MRAELLLSPPSQCVRNLAAGKASVGLVPVAAVKEIPDARIITDHCLGAVGDVRTVVVLSQVPLEKIERIFLDTHSRTSVLLARVLAREYWKIAPGWETLDDLSRLDAPGPGDAFLLIGDKVMDYEGRFRYVYDLAGEWRRYAGMPFVFAAWVSRGEADPAFVERLNRALAFGTAHCREAVRAWGGNVSYETACDYLTRNMSFVLDGPKKEAMRLFLEKADRLRKAHDPG